MSEEVSFARETHGSREINYPHVLGLAANQGQTSWSLCVLVKAVIIVRDVIISHFHG